MATAVKNAARIDYETGRMNFASYDTLCLDLHAALGEDDAVIAPGDDHTIPFNLSFYFGVLAKNQGLLGDDVAFHVAINAERAFYCERAFKRDALVNESSPLFAAALR